MKLGLCCISEILKAEGVSFKTMTRSTATKLGSGFQSVLLDKIDNNLYVLDKVINHCNKLGINHYRLSSNMFPLIGEQSTGLDISFLEQNGVCEKLNKIGNIIKQLGITVSTHPSQYVVLPSLKETTVSNAIFDLELHGWLHDMLGLEQDLSNPINIHVGISSYNPVDIYDNFMKSFERLSNSVKTRLVLENDDKGFWNAQNLFEFFSKHFKLTFDNLHYDCNQPNVGDFNFWFDKYKKLWNTSNHTPIFHWSEGGKNGKKSSHVDYFSEIPNFVIDNPQVIYECEVKAKDNAILAIFNQ